MSNRNERKLLSLGLALAALLVPPVQAERDLQVPISFPLQISAVIDADCKKKLHEVSLSADIHYGACKGQVTFRRTRTPDGRPMARRHHSILLNDKGVLSTNMVLWRKHQHDDDDDAGGSGPCHKGCPHHDDDDDSGHGGHHDDDDDGKGGHHGDNDDDDNGHHDDDDEGNGHQDDDDDGNGHHDDDDEGHHGGDDDDGSHCDGEDDSDDDEGKWCRTHCLKGHPYVFLVLLDAKGDALTEEQLLGPGVEGLHVMANVTATATMNCKFRSAGCRSRKGSSLTMNGDIALGALYARFIFRNAPDGLHTSEVYRDVTLVAEGTRIAVPAKVLKNRLRPNPLITLRLLNEDGTLMLAPMVLGRCSGL